MSLLESQTPRKEDMVILEGHIRNINLSDSWTLLLETLPAGSPLNSLQTVSDNIENLAKKTDEMSIKVNSNTGQLSNTMNIVADMKSQDVACRQQVNEHKIRLHNLNQLPNFRDLSFQDKLTLVRSLIL